MTMCHREARELDEMRAMRTRVQRKTWVRIGTVTSVTARRLSVSRSVVKKERDEVNEGGLLAVNCGTITQNAKGMK